jgi:thiol:disulfide interchange protein
LGSGLSIGAVAQPPKSALKSGVAWHQDLRAAIKQAAKLDKPLMIEFMAEWCPSCKMMEDSTFVNPGVIERADRFIPVRIDVDKQKDVADGYKASAMKYGGIGIPNILFMTPDGVRLKHRIGYLDAAALTAVMDSVLTETK